MEEIASYTSWQCVGVIFLKRDKYGRLVRKKGSDGLPEGVEVDDQGRRVISDPVPFSEAFRQVGEKAGKTKKMIRKEWRQYKASNPAMKIRDVGDIGRE